MRNFVLVAALTSTFFGCNAGDESAPRADTALRGAFAGPAVELNDIAWKHRMPRPGSTGAAATADTVYVSSADGTLSALSAGQGEVLWTTELGAPSHAIPVVTRHRVLVGTDDGVTAVGLDGTRQWTHRTPAPVDGAITVSESVAYFGSRDGSIWAVDAVGGTLIWKATTAGPISSGCAVTSGSVICGGADGYVWALDPATGEQKWSWSPGAAVRGVAVDGDTVFVTAGTRISAVGLAKPEVKWQFDVGAVIETPPTIASGSVFAGTGRGDLVALAIADGRQLWRKSLESPLRGAITASGGTLYVPATTAGVRAVSATDGETSWTFATDGPVVSAASPATGRLVITDLAGSVYAVE